MEKIEPDDKIDNPEEEPVCRDCEESAMPAQSSLFKDSPNEDEPEKASKHTMDKLMRVHKTLGIQVTVYSRNYSEKPMHHKQ